MRQRSRPAVPDDAAVIENFLEFGGGRIALSRGQIGLAANVGRIEAGNIADERNLPELNGWRCGLQIVERRDGFFRFSASCARIGGNQSACICVSSG